MPHHMRLALKGADVAGMQDQGITHLHAGIVGIGDQDITHLHAHHDAHHAPTCRHCWHKGPGHNAPACFSGECGHRRKGRVLLQQGLQHVLLADRFIRLGEHGHRCKGRGRHV
eukprot:1152273-Pelagomonas_calceolata.AAC.2